MKDTNRLEYAREHDRRALGIDLIRRQLQLVRSGALQCAVCGHRAATRLQGSAFTDVAPVCPGCAADKNLDRRIALQRAQVDTMRGRR